MQFAVVQFPGSNCDQDCVHVLKEVLQHEATLLWHKDAQLGQVDAVVIPGGFSYGDYLRTGAVAQFSPIMRAVREFATAGGLVLGICNGFQILCESGLLPGALVKNRALQFCCERVYLRTLNRATPFSNCIPVDRLLCMPIAHGEGCYFADDQTVEQLGRNGQILWQYVDGAGEASGEANPNGSVANIAGVCNEQGNVAGLMPHPERAGEALLGCDDGRFVFESMIEALRTNQRTKAA